MIHNHPLPAEETLDGCHRCCGCDRPRTGPVAYCPDCNELTESFLSDEQPGSVTGSALNRLEGETLAACSRVNVARRLDELAARRKST